MCKQRELNVPVPRHSVPLDRYAFSVPFYTILYLSILVRPLLPASVRFVHAVYTVCIILYIIYLKKKYTKQIFITILKEWYDFDANLGIHFNDFSFNYYII